MPKRMIDTDLWNDEDIIENFTAEDKYFWLYLLTNPHNKMCGVLRNSPALMARDMGLHKDTIINLIYRFERIHQLICCDKDTNEIFIMNWYKHNWTKSPKILSIIEKEKTEIKSSMISDLVDDRISCLFSEKPENSIGYRYPSNTNTNTNSNSISDIFNYWNEKRIIMHRELTEDISKAIEKGLKSYKEEEIKTYIDRYAKVIGDKDYFWHYKWSLKDFLTRKDGISSFTDEGSKWVSYCEIKNNKPEKARFGNFDAEDAFAKALKRSYNENLGGSI
jgi:hypothetical protein